MLKKVEKLEIVLTTVMNPKNVLDPPSLFNYHLQDSMQRVHQDLSYWPFGKMS